MNTIFINHLTDNVTIAPMYKDSANICFACSNEYAPFCGVAIASIIENVKNEHNYDILVIEQNISEENKRLFLLLTGGHPNISIRFINIASISKNFSIEIHGYFSIESVFKLLLVSDIFREYQKFIACDSDLIFDHDIYELFQVELGDNLIGAVDDVIMKSNVSRNVIIENTKVTHQYTSAQYITEYLGISDSNTYFNTGVILINLNLFRKTITYDEIINRLQNKPYWFIEQDFLNEFCYPKIYPLNMKWNAVHGRGALELTKTSISPKSAKEYENALNGYYVMHYAGSRKPWKYTDVDFSDRFFKYARSTPWYETILTFNNQPMIQKYSLKLTDVYKYIQDLQDSLNKLSGQVANNSNHMSQLTKENATLNKTIDNAKLELTFILETIQTQALEIKELQIKNESLNSELSRINSQYDKMAVDFKQTLLQQQNSAWKYFFRSIAFSLKRFIRKATDKQ